MRKIFYLISAGLSTLLALMLLSPDSWAQRGVSALFKGAEAVEAVESDALKPLLGYALHRDASGNLLVPFSELLSTPFSSDRTYSLNKLQRPKGWKAMSFGALDLPVDAQFTSVPLAYNDGPAPTAMAPVATNVPPATAVPTERPLVQPDPTNPPTQTPVAQPDPTKEPKPTKDPVSTEPAKGSSDPGKGHDNPGKGSSDPGKGNGNGKGNDNPGKGNGNGKGNDNPGKGNGKGGKP